MPRRNARRVLVVFRRFHQGREVNEDESAEALSVASPQKTTRQRAGSFDLLEREKSFSEFLDHPGYGSTKKGAFPQPGRESVHFWF